MWTCGLVDVWPCGRVDLWTRGLVDVVAAVRESEQAGGGAAGRRGGCSGPERLGGGQSRHSPVTCGLAYPRRRAAPLEPAGRSDKRPTTVALGCEGRIFAAPTMHCASLALSTTHQATSLLCVTPRHATSHHAAPRHATPLTVLTHRPRSLRSLF